MTLAILLVFVVIDILLILYCEIRPDSASNRAATVVIPLVIFLLPGSSLTFDNNSRSSRGTEVLDGKDKLSVSCVFVDAGKKTRHDGTTYEVWDTVVYESHKVLKPES